jgi:hypothetical protein
MHAQRWKTKARNESDIRQRNLAKEAAREKPDYGGTKNHNAQVPKKRKKNEKPSGIGWSCCVEYVTIKEMHLSW